MQSPEDHAEEGLDGRFPKHRQDRPTGRAIARSKMTGASDSETANTSTRHWWRTKQICGFDGRMGVLKSAEHAQMLASSIG
jgi:hypothetical protein